MALRIKLICLICGVLIYLAAYLPYTGAAATGSTATQDRPVDFVTQIEPIFKAACYDCHSGKKAKAGLRLDVKAAAFRGGVSGAAIVPGNSKESLLVHRLLGLGGEPRMPLGGEPLDSRQIAIIQTCENRFSTLRSGEW